MNPTKRRKIAENENSSPFPLLKCPEVVLLEIAKLLPNKDRRALSGSCTKWRSLLRYSDNPLYDVKKQVDILFLSELNRHWTIGMNSFEGKPIENMQIEMKGGRFAAETKEIIGEMKRMTTFKKVILVLRTVHVSTASRMLTFLHKLFPSVHALVQKHAEYEKYTRPLIEMVLSTVLLPKISPNIHLLFHTQLPRMHLVPENSSVFNEEQIREKLKNWTEVNAKSIDISTIPLSAFGWSGEAITAGTCLNTRKL